MKLNIKLLIITLLLLSVLAACSPSSTLTPPQATSDNQDSVIGSTNSRVPIVIPTETVPQPPNINPEKILGTVYISDKDKKFHRADCPNLGIINTPVDRQSAIIQGYTACPVCNP